MLAVICAVTVSANVSAYAGVNDMDYIVHAGGQAGYSIGTNSREAVNNSFMVKGLCRQPAKPCERK